MYWILDPIKLILIRGPFNTLDAAMQTYVRMKCTYEKLVKVIEVEFEP